MDNYNLKIEKRLHRFMVFEIKKLKKIEKEQKKMKEEQQKLLSEMKENLVRWG